MLFQYTETSISLSHVFNTLYSNNQPISDQICHLKSDSSMTKVCRLHGQHSLNRYGLGLSHTHLTLNGYVVNTHSACDVGTVKPTHTDTFTVLHTVKKETDGSVSRISYGQLGFLFRVWPGQSFQTGCSFEILCVLKIKLKNKKRKKQ